MTVWIHSPFDNLPQEGFRKQRYWLMAEAFAAIGHEVVYITSTFNHGTKAARQLTRKVDSKVQLVTVPTLSYKKNVSLRRILSHLLYARSLSQLCTCPQSPATPDLIISAVPMLGAAEVLLRYARQSGAKFVIDIQDAWPETFHRLGVPRFLLGPMYALARRLYRSADQVTGVSARYASVCKREDYKVFYHGIESASSHSALSTKHSALCTSLVYIGNLGEGYDLETVIEALERNEKLTLDIAGKGPKEATLRSLVEAKGLFSRIRFHGYLDSAALSQLLARSQVGIIPMRDDSWVGLPYKLGDYLAAGLKVVSSLHGECGELLKKYKIGATYAFKDVSSLLKALSELDSSCPVELPAELCAERIYADYAEFIHL